MFVRQMGLVEAGITAALGYAMIFFGLILLMIVIMILGKFFTEKKVAPAPQPEPIPEEPVAPAPAPGSAGTLKLHNVEPKVAAMLMAIVADKMGKPINELRFISIKEVEQ